MKTITMISISLLLLPTMLFSAPEEDYSHIEIEAQHVQGSVYMLKGAGGNIAASIGEDGILIVDDQFAPLSERIQAELSNFNSGEIKFVLNTHWHFDHTGGNENFGKGATIIAHDNVRKRLSKDQLIKFFDKEVKATKKEGLPVITFEESISIYFNGEEIQLLHYPKGHTDGDSIVYFKGSNVVHMGDLFFNRRFPFVDLESGGSVLGLIQNVETILPTLANDTRLIPGHGDLGNKQDLQTYHDVLLKTFKHVRSQMEFGVKDLSSLQQEAIPEQYSSWGEGLISTQKWIELIYNDILYS